MFLVRRMSGPRPHAAKVMIPIAGINFRMRGLPCKALYDLHVMVSNFDISNC